MNEVEPRGVSHFSLRPIEVQERRQRPDGVLCVMCRADRSDGRLGVVQYATGGQSTIPTEKGRHDITVDPGPRCQRGGGENISADSFALAAG